MEESAGNSWKFFREEDIELLKSAYKRMYKGLLEVSEHDSFIEHMRALEKSVKVSYNIYGTETPITFIHSSDDGVVIISLDMSLHLKPYYSVDMIVTRNGSPKELTRLLRVISDFWDNRPCKIPAMVDIVDHRMTDKILRNIKTKADVVKTSDISIMKDVQ